MGVIYENDEDKYYDKEDIKKYKKGSQSGIESRGSGLYLTGTKHGNGLYLPSRNNYDGEALGIEGDGIIDSIINAGKTVIESLSNNASTISNAANAVGSLAGAAENVANAVKNIREAQTSKKNNKLEEFKKANRESLDRIAGEGFRIIN